MHLKHSKWLPQKFVFGQGSAQDPAGGAHDAPPDSLVGWGGGYLNPISILHPLDAIGISVSSPTVTYTACGASILAPSALDPCPPPFWNPGSAHGLRDTDLEGRDPPLTSSSSGRAFPRLTRQRETMFVTNEYVTILLDCYSITKRQLCRYNISYF